MRLGTASLAGLVTLSCLPQGGYSTNNYGAAVAATAVMVAAVAVHRARTGDCWGHCGPGLACDATSGLCVRGECDPACGTGETCQLLSVGPKCGPDPAAGMQITLVRPANITGASPQPSLPPFVPLPPLAPLFPLASAGSAYAPLASSPSASAPPASR